MDSKVYYVKSADLSRLKQYLVCLVCSADLLAGGVVVEIHHGQSAKYYSRVLAEKINGSVADAAVEVRAALAPLELDALEDAPPALAQDFGTLNCTHHHHRTYTVFNQHSVYQYVSIQKMYVNICIYI